MRFSWSPHAFCGVCRALGAWVSHPVPPLVVLCETCIDVIIGRRITV